jgi:hypothetical protein
VELLSDESYRITAVHSGKVLTVLDPKTDGANVVQYQWTGSDNQRWYIEACSDGYVKIECN